MTKPINKISMQSLNALFAILEQQPDSALWIRGSDFQRQIYINENFEKIWQRSTSELYQNPNTVLESLYPIDRDDINKLLAEKNEHHLEKDNQFYYRIITPDGKVKFIKDWHYLLTDDGGNLLGFAGLVQEVSQTQWQQQSVSYRQRQSPDPKALLQQHVFDILQNELHLKANGIIGNPQQSAQRPKVMVFDSNKQAIVLSRREIEVAVCLSKGMSAKETANNLCVSTRTVEFHLNNIKDKAGCRTKLELLSRIQVL